MSRLIVPVKKIFILLLLLALSFSALWIFFSAPAAAERIGDHYISINGSEMGAANIVTAVLGGFRGLDTLGEVTILFLSTTGIGLILSMGGQYFRWLQFRPHAVLTAAIPYLFTAIVFYGVYIIVHGHLSPGGGFQGGAVIATGFMLLFFTDSDHMIKKKAIYISESLSGLSFVILGVLGLVLAGSFLMNFLPHSVRDTGRLLSAGTLPLLSLFIGIKVGAELSGLAQSLIGRKEHKEVDK
ncbi:MAG: hypothetical protein JXR86_10450 [Spirochaetales bacterium]|nr:hypothetical protein [Spirochaetales bacterium]